MRVYYFGELVNEIKIEKISRPIQEKTFKSLSSNRLGMESLGEIIQNLDSGSSAARIFQISHYQA